MELISADNAPEAIGPYSHAVDIGGLLFCSGQIPLDPETMKLVEGGIEEQTRQVFSNVRAVLEAGHASLEDVAKTTIFLADMADFPVVNGIYAQEFGGHKPARSTVEVAGLPLGALIEIECMAVLPKRRKRPDRRQGGSASRGGPSGAPVRGPGGGGPKAGSAAKRRRKRKMKQVQGAEGEF